jgi:carboxyl-terminal processing protease
VVGADHTFGKGTIQTVRDLPKGLGALKVTVGMFFTSGGYYTQHRGVESDIVFPSLLSQEEIGEKSYDYSLPPQKLPSFLSSDAFVHKGPNSWKILDKETIKALKVRATSRISKNEKFAEIKEDIKKSEERGKVIDLAEVMKEKEEEDKKDPKKKDEENRTLTAAEKAKKYLERADVNEALNIAADLVIYQEEKGVILTANQSQRDASSVKKQ